MLLIEDLHPSLMAVVHRMLLGQNLVLKSDVADFDGCVLRVKVTPAEDGEVEEDGSSPSGAPSPAKPASPTTTKPADDDGAPPPPRVVNTVMMKAEILIRLKHTVPLAILNKFDNYAAVVGSLFPKGTFEFDADKKGVSVTIPLAATAAVRDSTLALASQLRHLSYYPIFMQQAERFLAKPDTVVPLRIPYRTTESMYMFVNKKNDFYVVVSLVVENKDEQLFVRNFLQSFTDTKRLERSVAAAPAFFYSHNKAPQDLPPNILGEPENDNTFWCNFQLNKPHLDRPARVQEVAKQLVNFRNNLMFHIHGCRSYMHALMRQRATGAVKIIERAKTNTTGKAKVELK